MRHSATQGASVASVIMIRFYFHTEDGQPLRDTEGTEFVHLAAAQIEAVRLMGDLLRERPREFWRDRALKVIVTDGSGRVAFILDLKASEGAASPASRP